MAVEFKFRKVISIFRCLFIVWRLWREYFNFDTQYASVSKFFPAIIYITENLTWSVFYILNIHLEQEILFVPRQEPKQVVKKTVLTGLGEQHLRSFFRIP